MRDEKTVGGESPAKPEPKYSVKLNHETYQMPTIKGKPVTGDVYHRGGYAFGPNAEHIVSESELPKFKLKVYPKRERGEKQVAEFIYDPHLTITPIKQTE
jgi:hypothetical protein